MANLMAGNGFTHGKSALHAKVKFTVSVRGRQWSSARYVHETVEEFTRVIQRNARRLDFISENDTIQRLQLARGDGSESEELDVDATLEDVIICMGDKLLVAIIIPCRSPAPSSSHREAERDLFARMAHTSQCKSTVQNNGTPKPPTRYRLTRSMPFLPLKEISGNPGLKPVPVLFKRRVASREPLLRRLQITRETTISSSNPKPSTAFLNEILAAGGNGGQNDLPRANLNRPNGAVISNSYGPVALIGSMSTPSPAELAHFLVKGSSLPSNRSTAVSDSGNHFCSQYIGSASPAPAFHNLASAFLRRLPMVIPTTSMVCGSTPADHIASTLAQFLASHIRAVIPGNNGVASRLAVSGKDFPHYKWDSSNYTQDNAPCTIELEDRHCFHIRNKPLDSSDATPVCRYSSGNGLDEATVSGLQEIDEKERSSPTDKIVASAPSNGCPKTESMHGRSELIFFVNRRRKTGVGAHHLKLADLSIYFHLSVVDAAKKLGVSQTTLKKACRKFGLKRWPGRKVRSLESTIHGLKHTIAVGQEAGMEQLTEAYIRSEVIKLQQEMDELVHGTLAQSPVKKSGDLYKRYFSRGWRSKYQSPSLNFDLNTDSQDNDEQMSSSHGKNPYKTNDKSGVAEPEYSSKNLGRCQLGSNRTPDCKGDQKCNPNKIKRNSCDNMISFDVGVGTETCTGNCAHGANGTNIISGSWVEKLEKDNRTLQIVQLLTKQDSFYERSLKRPKLRQI